MRYYDPNDQRTSLIQEDEIEWCRENPTAPGAAWLLGMFEAWWRQPTNDVTDELRKATEMFRSIRPRQPFRMQAFYIWLTNRADRETVPGYNMGPTIVPLASTDLINARDGMHNTRSLQKMAGVPFVLYRFPFERVIPEDKIAHLRTRNRLGKVDEYFAYIGQPGTLKDDTIGGFIDPKTMHSTFMANSIADKIREMAHVAPKMRKAGAPVELRRFVRGEPVADPIFQIAHEVTGGTAS